MAYTIMETNKSQDLQGEWATWRPGRINDVVPVQRQEKADAPV